MAGAALAAGAPPAAGLSIGVGTPPGPLTPFQPGATARASGTLVVASPLASWTLTAVDGTPGTATPGRLQRSALCSGGVPYLAQPLTVTATALLGGATSAGGRALGAVPVSLATGPATLATTLTTSFTQAIGAAETLVSGCSYSVTVTYTLS